MHRLLERAHRATRFSRENGRDVPASLVARISRAWARILDHAIAFHEAQPPLRTGKRGRNKRRIGHNLALRLRKHKEGCLRFLTDPRTPFTNNEAERDLQMAKLRQKISGGFRSDRGAYNFARMRAVIATARKQGWNVLQTLVHPDPIQLIPQLRLREHRHRYQPGPPQSLTYKRSGQSDLGSYDLDGRQVRHYLSFPSHAHQAGW